MNRLLAAAAVLALSACAVSTTEIAGPNGTAYEIDCSRGRRTMGDCYNAAAVKCPRGYRLLAMDTSVSRGGGFIMSSGLLAMEMDQARSIIVECKTAGH
jgi:hypothetical protein